MKDSSSCLIWKGLTRLPPLQSPSVSMRMLSSAGERESPFQPEWLLSWCAACLATGDTDSICLGTIVSMCVRRGWRSVPGSPSVPSPRLARPTSNLTPASHTRHRRQGKQPCSLLHRRAHHLESWLMSAMQRRPHTKCLTQYRERQDCFGDWH